MIRKRLRFLLPRLFAVIFGLVLALILVEGGIRLFYTSLPMGLQIALRDVHVNPFSSQPLAPPPLWQSDTDYGTIVRPGAVNSLQSGSPDVTFRVSTYAWWGGRVGFRSPMPTDGSLGAVALGDSFTFCFTEADSCWVNYLAQHTDMQWSNLGQPVTGSTSHARLFYDFVAKPALGLKQPHLVIWQFYGNDYNDDYGLAELDKTNKTPPPAVAAPAPAPQNGLALWLRENSTIYVIIDTLTRGTAQGINMFVDPYKVRIGDKFDLWFGQSYIRDAFDMTQARNLEGEEYSHEAILKTRDLVEQNGGKFVLILIPTKEEVYRPWTEPQLGKNAIDAIAAPRLRLLDFCAAQKLTCFDLMPALQEYASKGIQLYYSKDQHLDVEGNLVIGEAIGKFLDAQGITKFHS